MAAIALMSALAANGFAAAAETPPDPFAHPPALEKDVRFWIRVYTEVTTDQGLLHDDWNLGLVYEVLRFDPAASPAQRSDGRRVCAKSAQESANSGHAAHRRCQSVGYRRAMGKTTSGT